MPTPKKKKSFVPTTLTRQDLETADVNKSRYISKPGVTEEVVREISRQKNEPEWMLKKRLQGLALFKNTPLPSWGPDLRKLDLESLTYFVRPDTEESKTWDDVPADIKRTFDKLGIPEAEKKALAGVGAQYDSDIVYHNLKKKWDELGVIFENMDVAVQKYPELVKKYFMTQCVPVNDHKFVMLHAAVWSGGTFIYVPKNVAIDLPLQAYFRMNAKNSGQFEHTLIIADEGSSVHYIEGCSAPRYGTSSLHAGCVEIFVHADARVRYSSIENWSKDTYNLNTKRSLVDENGIMEWVNGNMGSGTTMLYPSSILRGRGARSDSLGVAFAGPGQNQDTGAKAIHAAPNTSSTIISKSISRDGGVNTFRGLIKIMPHATNVNASMVCDALLIGKKSIANTIPELKIKNDQVTVSHEARVGKIGEEEIFFLQSRGLNEQEATRLVVSGFIEPIIKALPVEYALELNRLIEMEMEGAVG
ncbi:MAG: Fe-S cluster assembly protein SufB [Candidatus Magasanikbacteria bacterium]|nr:Fe-S cluster assembly protein SufB [Candidatus Magasanikbacteria bacterium]